MKKNSITALSAFVLSALIVSGCGGKESQANPSAQNTTNAKETVNPAPAGTGGATQTEPTTVPRATRTYQTDFLLFNGSGTWAAEVSSLKQLFNQKGASFQEVDQSDLNAMNLDQIAKFGAIVWPGGVGSTQMEGLSEATKIKLRQAVQEKGVGWIGFCAGSFVAVAPPPPAGKNPSYGLGIVAAPLLEYYYLEEELHAAGKSDFTIVQHTLADGSKRDLVWYGGPVVPETQAGVIARYPNGQPSISQTWSGNGFVILSAVHPAAPQSVRDSYGVIDRDGTDYDLAWAMLEGVLKQKELPSL